MKYNCMQMPYNIITCLIYTTTTKLSLVVMQHFNYLKIQGEFRRTQVVAIPTNESFVIYPPAPHATHSGLKISFTGPSDKMSDDFEFGSDICVMMSDDLQFSVAWK